MVAVGAAGEIVDPRCIVLIAWRINSLAVGIQACDDLVYHF